MERQYVDLKAAIKHKCEEYKAIYAYMDEDDILFKAVVKLHQMTCEAAPSLKKALGDAVEAARAEMKETGSSGILNIQNFAVAEESMNKQVSGCVAELANYINALLRYVEGKAVRFGAIFPDE